MDVDVDPEDELHQRIESLEAENGCLTQQINQLENALQKQKKFHRKFAEDVTEAEEMRIKDFTDEVKGLREENKRVMTENRVLATDKSFYQTAYDLLTREDDKNISKERSNNSSQSMPKPSQLSYNTRSSELGMSPLPSNRFSASDVCSPSKTQNRNKSLKEVSKLSEKWFESSKKIKLKAAKLTKANASMRLKIKQLEKFKNKIQNRKSQQEASLSELQTLFESTRSTNKQIFNLEVLIKLGQLSKE